MKRIFKNEHYISNLLIRAAYHLAALRGNTLTQLEVSFILLRNYVPRSMKTQEIVEIINYSKAIKFMQKNFGKKITVEKVKDYNRIIMDELIKNNGEINKKATDILKKWCEELNSKLKNTKSDKDKLEVILEQHIKFEQIYPFAGGNGETGRILIIDSCLDENLVPVIIPGEEKKKYSSILKEGDKNLFLNWAIKLQEKERQEIYKILDYYGLEDN